jgi:hypothetical protein
MTKTQEKLLKKHLPKGWAETVSLMTGKSRRLVEYVAAGDRENEDVLDHLLILAATNKRTKSIQKKRFKKLAA